MEQLFPERRCVFRHLHQSASVLALEGRSSGTAFPFYRCTKEVLFWSKEVVPKTQNADSRRVGASAAWGLFEPRVEERAGKPSPGPELRSSACSQNSEFSEANVILT